MMKKSKVWSLSYEPDAPSIVWGMEEIQATHQNLVEPADYVAPSTHNGNLDNLMLGTESENRSIAVIDGDTHSLLGHISASYRAHRYAFDPANDRWIYNIG